MERLGMLGGMSWESTAVYYRIVNERVRELCGGLHSADCVLRSVDFAPVPVFDTTRLHAERAVDIALGRRSVQTVPGR